uniref:Uncharacterized protein n=1 Tax=Rhizophora mucronata TaxID=61149 RepID=A0A2P2QGF0_RHIMU
MIPSQKRLAADSDQFFLCTCSQIRSNLSSLSSIRFFLLRAWLRLTCQPSSSSSCSFSLSLRTWAREGAYKIWGTSLVRDRCSIRRFGGSSPR